MHRLTLVCCGDTLHRFALREALNTRQGAPGELWGGRWAPCRPSEFFFPHVLLGSS